MTYYPAYIPPPGSIGYSTDRCITELEEMAREIEAREHPLLNEVAARIGKNLQHKLDIRKINDAYRKVNHG